MKSLLLLTWPLGAFAQLITGTIKDDLGKPIPFANVGIPQIKQGTVADEAGQFKLDLSKAAPTNTLIISAVGYQVRSYTIKSLRNKTSLTVNLPEKVIQLLSANVIAKRSKSHRLGNKPGGAATISFASSLLGTELGTPIRLNHAAFIKAVNISLAENEHDSVQVRINMYRFVNGQITENLLPRSIVTFLPIGEQDFSLDISAEQIVLDTDFVLQSN